MKSRGDWADRKWAQGWGLKARGVGQHETTWPKTLSFGRSVPRTMAAYHQALSRLQSRHKDSDSSDSDSELCEEGSWAFPVVQRVCARPF